ncbi:MAG: YbaK/EbsC family protein [Patescibacteria group bacterium]
MAIPKKLLNHLKKHNVKHEVLSHRTVYTAYDLAQTTKRKLQEISKTLLMKADRAYYLVVIPAHYKLNVAKLKKHLRAKKISFAREAEMKSKFKVKPGAMTPFGSIHKVPVLIDSALVRVRDVIFNAGTFTESVRMKVKDFIALEEAQRGIFATRDKKKK